jgi:hypothetical protein
MSTTAPENSVQTIGRLAWTGAKVAYGVGVAHHIFSRSEREPLDPKRFADIQARHKTDIDFADTLADAQTIWAKVVREAIAAALAIKPGEPCYRESAEYVFEHLKTEAEHPLSIHPLDPAKRAELLKIHGWAVEMLPVWSKIRVERKRQTKIFQDEYLVKMGVKSKFDVWNEEALFQYERAFNYFLRFLIFGAIFMMIWLAIDPESAKAFDAMLPKWSSMW